MGGGDGWEAQEDECISKAGLDGTTVDVTLEKKNAESALDNTRGNERREAHEERAGTDKRQRQRERKASGIRRREGRKEGEKERRKDEQYNGHDDRCK